MSRSEFRAASYWQFMEIVDGWLAAHVPGKEGLSSDEENALFDLAVHSAA